MFGFDEDLDEDFSTVKAYRFSNEYRDEKFCYNYILRTF